MVDRTKLFDAEEHYRSGSMPWSFLGWPTKIADEDGLPWDEETLGFLGILQERGVSLGTWSPPIGGEPETWAVVRHRDSGMVFDVLAMLERDGVIDRGYLEALTERLRGMGASGE